MKSDSALFKLFKIKKSIFLFMYADIYGLENAFMREIYINTSFYDKCPDAQSLLQEKLKPLERAITRCQEHADCAVSLTIEPRKDFVGYDCLVNTRPKIK